ncbi:MAG TPA: phosphate ABC transporter substrate-binding protein PstS [Paenalcaligenes sp.]|nr:phosphate ABC transporter substrate-binding protein PstS [Paenalcaligenes sp.]
MRIQSYINTVLGGLLLIATTAIHAVNITGAGASLPYPVYAKWAAEYHQATHKQVNYQSIGSGGGQQQIIVGTVAFGATDDPMSAQMLEDEDLLQFPAVIGGIVPVVNLPGVGPGELRLTGPLLADIYLGKITRWDDPAIQEINPDLDLPARSIVVVHRSDGSGTTFNWTNYLAQVSPQWQAQVGVGKAVKWPLGQGGKGNEGVAAYVRQLNYSIGYLEYAYAIQNELSWTQLENREGHFVEPGDHSFTAAALEADWAGTPGFGVVLTHVQGEDSWPITAATFILIKKNQRHPERGKAALSFFDWAFRQGRQTALDLHYVPLPNPLIDAIEDSWKNELRSTSGAVLWP